MVGIDITARTAQGFSQRRVRSNGVIQRSHQLGEHLEMYGSRVAANGMLAPTVLVDGQAVGVWKRTLNPRTISFAVTEFRPLTARERTGIAAEQTRYSRFLGREVAAAS